MIAPRLFLISWAGVLVLTGCHEKAIHATSPLIDQRVFLSSSTFDLTSALPATPTLTISVAGQRTERAADFAVVVSQEAYLLDPTSGQRISMVVDSSALYPEIPAGYGSALPPSISFQPTSPLSPGWYELHLGPTAQQAQRSLEGLTEFAPGDSGLRFRVGSGPVIASVRFCSPPDVRPYVEVNFSEPMKLDTSSSTVTNTVHVQDARGASLQCDEPPLSNDGSTDVTPHANRGDTLRRWSLQCDSLPAMVHLEVATHAVNTLGQQAQLSSSQLSRLDSIDVQSLPEENDCKLLKF